jgi:hypothetical protein
MRSAPYRLIRMAIKMASEAAAFILLLIICWRGAETWGFHESPSYPNMYCFLAWRERIESTHKTHHVGTKKLSIISQFRSCFS